MKPSGASHSRPEALVIAPEPPYPPIGGGALRTASILEYLRPRYRLDVITFRQPGAEDPRPHFPHDIAVHVIDLPFHANSTPARAWRNLSRAIRGVPPLVDRFGGFQATVADIVRGRRFALGLIEHFWCAPYAELFRPVCQRLVLDLHNIESVLLRRCAAAEPFPAGLLFRRFAATCRNLELRWLREFDLTLVTSEADRESLGCRHCIAYPNAIPCVPMPLEPKNNEIVFSGNLEYAPNRSAVGWFHRRIWPELSRRRPDLTWSLVGRNPHGVADRLNGQRSIHLTGPVPDAIRRIARARLAVVPILSGSGTRVKIIEAWAAGVPVVSTTIGAEGLPCKSPDHLLIADTPESFLSAVETILDDDVLCSRLTANARALYEQQLTWEAAWKHLENAGL